MAIAVFVGFFCGFVGAVCSALMNYVINLPGVYNRLGGHWYLVPAVFGVAAALLYSLAVPASRRIPSRVPGQGLLDLLESYHFGYFAAPPAQWFARGSISLVNGVLGGVFGLGGGILEMSFAALPLFSRAMRLFIDERQIFVVSALSASIGMALGAPFSGALIVLELVHILDARVRVANIVAALSAFGAGAFLHSSWAFGPTLESLGSRMTIVGSLFTALRPLNLELPQWGALTAAAVGVGVLAVFFGALSNLALSEGYRTFNRLLGARMKTRLLVTGLLMSATVWLVPESFNEPWRVWEDVAWLRLSTTGAALMVLSGWTLFVIAFSGWGTTGIFAPILTLGALVGYGFGNAFAPAWALPLAIAGAISTMSSVFRVPMAACALALELGHDGPVWWLTTVAVFAGELVSRVIANKPLHERLLEQRGIQILGGRVTNVLASLPVSEVMQRDVEMISESATIEELRAAVAASKHNYLGVLSRDGGFLGLLALEPLPGRIRRALMPDARPEDIRAVERVLDIGELVEGHTPAVQPGDSLEKALRLLQDSPCLAVVDEERVLRGLIFEHVVVGRYKREIARAGILMRQPETFGAASGS